MINCRICNNNINSFFLTLRNSPLANSFINKEQLLSHEIHYPLNLFFCDYCYLVMSQDFEKIENIFSDDYVYHSSYSTSWLTHCKEYTDMIVDKYNITSKSLVVEIASNDGYLLQYFKEKDIPSLGIEPASGVANICINKGIETEISFFSSSLAQKLVSEGKKADLLIGNNVLAHTPYIKDFVKGMKLILKDDGVITMEFPHLLNLLNLNQFDTIYHEHFSYLSLYTVKYLFELNNLIIFDVEKLSSHGGSLRVYAKHKENNSDSKKISNRVNEIISEELDYGLSNLETYYNFEKRIKKIKRDLLKELIRIKDDGKTICAYGAPAKGNTLLNYCGIGTDFIDYTVDISPFKQNKFLPGSCIPVKNIDNYLITKPDYILILPWNLKNEIITQLNKINTWGAKYLIVIPKLEVI